MNRTEFINLLIVNEKESLEKFKDYCLKYPDDDTFPKCVKDLENRIKNLEETKDILEAWEVVKRELKLTLIEDKQKYDFVYYWLNYHPYELLEIEKKDYQKLKKALEVEDNE